MDLKIKGLDTRYVKDHLTVKTYPKPGYDVYLMRIYYKGAYLAEVEVDGLELEMWRYKDDADPDSYTYDELEEKGFIVGMPGYNKNGDPIARAETSLERKKRYWKEGHKLNGEGL